jgi:hypothetical protein
MVELSKAKEDAIKNGCPSGLDLHPDFVARQSRSVRHTIAVSEKVTLMGLSLRHALSHKIESWLRNRHEIYQCSE